MVVGHKKSITMIQQITIEGYKSIKAQTVKLLPVNLLIGGNGIGKSNFISIFSLIRNLYEQNLQNYVLAKGGGQPAVYGEKGDGTYLFRPFFCSPRQ